MAAVIESPCLGNCMHSVSMGGPQGVGSEGRDRAGMQGQLSGWRGSCLRRSSWWSCVTTEGRRRGCGESFLRVHWVAVPKAMPARRINRSVSPVLSAWLLDSISNLQLLLPLHHHHRLLTLGGG
jgi:hypothetical protein